MLKVLIVDDEYDYLEILFNKLNDIIVDNIKIVKICNDGEKALQYIMKFNCKSKFQIYFKTGI